MNMKSLLTRAASAVVAVITIYLLYHFLGINGFKVLVAFGSLVGSYELMKMLLKDSDSRSNKFVFYCLLVTIFSLSSLYPGFSAIIFCFVSIVYLLFSILILHKFESLEELHSFQSKSIMGFFYMGLLPSFMIQILNLPHGMIWFIALLAIVFAGDIGAYLVGMNFGKHKIMPLVSPKKTVEGSIGGILFSIITAVALSFYLEHINPMALVLLAIPTSVVAQFGDFFESVIKRVAEVKDSGKIMPGHGGVLDRVDGVLFAAPVILFGAHILERLPT
jgi:phosphatidate cytidylyltransferase